MLKINCFSVSIFSCFGLDSGGFSRSNLEASWPLCPLKTDPGGHFDAVGCKNRRKLHLGPPKTRFWRLPASILEGLGLDFRASRLDFGMSGDATSFQWKQTFFLYPFLCAATWARSGTLPTATWISLSGAKFDPEADFDVRFAVPRQNPCQIDKNRKFRSEIFAESFFLASKIQTSEIVWNAFSQIFALIRAKFDR